MKRTFIIWDAEGAKALLLRHFGFFEPLVVLDPSHFRDGDSRYQFLMALGSTRSLRMHSGSALRALNAFHRNRPSWLFGYLGYGLQTEIEKLPHKKPIVQGFNDLYFFEPALLITLIDNRLNLELTEDPHWRILKEPLKKARDLEEFLDGFNRCMTSGIVTKDQGQFRIGPFAAGPETALDQWGSEHEKDLVPDPVHPLVPKKDYLRQAGRLLELMQKGDHYEINYCIPFVSRSRSSPVAPDFFLKMWAKLRQISPAPFSALWRSHSLWLLSSSPERFLQRQGNRILSQPMKGTAPRSGDPQEDALLKKRLEQSAKERSENTMITDLVRNDLSKVCEPGSVRVRDFCHVQSFAKVHQMISSVEGRLEKDADLESILQATFPMGSMTGAPKPRVLQRIAETEILGRGVFSGALGYIDPQGNFDFNVLIRTLLGNAQTGELAWPAGSALTVHCNPEMEYQECLLKAQLFRELLGQDPAEQRDTVK